MTGNKIITACIVCTVIILFLVIGCHEQQKAVDLYIEAVMLKELGEDEMAIEKLNRALQLEQNLPLAYSLQGEIYRDINDYEKSAASYEKATQLDPWSFKDFFQLGQLYQVMGKLPQATKAFGRACELKPEDIDAHIAAARCYLQVKDYDQALMYGRHAEQIDPNTLQVQKLLAEIYQARKKYKRAIRHYTRALRIDSSDTGIVISLAICYIKAGDYSSAVPLLMFVSQDRPDSSIAYQYLGYCYWKLGEPEKAIEAYNNAIKIDKRDWQAHRGLGVAYMTKALKNKDETLKAKALQHWRRSLAIQPHQSQRETLLKLIAKYSR